MRKCPKVGERVQYVGVSCWAEHLEVTGVVTAVHGPTPRTDGARIHRTILRPPDWEDHGEVGDNDADEYQWYVVFKPDHPIPPGWPYEGAVEFESRVGDLQAIEE
jgi:hypothetical protein